MLFEPADDDALMKQIALGNQKAFRQLFDRHASRVLGYCTRFMGGGAKGEDATQEVWMKVVRAAPSYQGEGKFLGWLLTIARTTCLSELRGNGGLEELVATDEVIEVADDRESLENQMMNAQNLQQLKRQIEALPEAQRAVLILWMSHEASYDDICRDTGLSLATVKSLLFRARQTLEKCIKDAS